MNTNYLVIKASISWHFKSSKIKTRENHQVFLPIMHIIKFTKSFREWILQPLLLFSVGPGLWVKADCGYCHLFISMKQPPLTPFLKPQDVSYLLINDICEYNLPYPQSAFTHNPGMTLFSIKLDFSALLSVQHRIGLVRPFQSYAYLHIDEILGSEQSICTKTPVTKTELTFGTICWTKQNYLISLMT